MRVQLCTLTDTSPASLSDISLDDAISILADQHKSNIQPTDSWRAELTILSPAGLDIEADGDQTWDMEYSERNQHEVNKLIETMGLNPGEVVIIHNTVQFNRHFPPLSHNVSSTPYTPQTYSITEYRFGVIWKHGSARRLTTGLVWFYDHNGHRQAHQLIRQMSASKHLVDHPLLPAVLTLKIQVEVMQYYIDDEADEIVATQLLSGHHLYGGTILGEGDAGVKSVLRDLDLTSMTRKICGLAVNITTSALFMKRLVDLSTLIIEEADAMTPVKEPPTSSKISQDTHPALTSTAALIQHTRFAKRRAEGLLSEAEAWQYKATIVVQTLLSLTNQRDQNISIDIAADSRTLAQQATRDSTSMKAIAAVTMCFLPGTFVASLFAMPMFDWNAAPTHSINRNFWIYWAVTLPLTFVVIVVWLGWTNKSTIHRLFLRLKRSEKSTSDKKKEV